MRVVQEGKIVQNGQVIYDNLGIIIYNDAFIQGKTDIFFTYNEIENKIEIYKFPDKKPLYVLDNSINARSYNFTDVVRYVSNPEHLRNLKDVNNLLKKYFIDIDDKQNKLTVYEIDYDNNCINVKTQLNLPVKVEKNIKFPINNKNRIFIYPVFTNNRFLLTENERCFLYDVESNQLIKIARKRENNSISQYAIFNVIDIARLYCLDKVNFYFTLHKNYVNVHNQKFMYVKRLEQSENNFCSSDNYNLFVVSEDEINFFIAYIDDKNIYPITETYRLFSDFTSLHNLLNHNLLQHRQKQIDDNSILIIDEKKVLYLYKFFITNTNKHIEKYELYNIDSDYINHPVIQVLYNSNDVKILAVTEFGFYRNAPRNSMALFVDKNNKVIKTLYYDDYKDFAISIIAKVYNIKPLFILIKENKDLLFFELNGNLFSKVENVDNDIIEQLKFFNIYSFEPNLTPEKYEFCKKIVNLSVIHKATKNIFDGIKESLTLQDNKKNIVKI